MKNPLITLHNIETDEVIEREMTDEEYATYLSVSGKRNDDPEGNK